jgi:outer membrane lipoprotein SlyB
VKEWALDIVVGWLGGSIVFGLLFDLVSGGSTDAQGVGAVVGTIVGIAYMRRRRNDSDSNPPPLAAGDSTAR